MREAFKPENENDQTQGQSAMVDPQTRSLLFQRLPQELRDYIYRLLFSNTRFMFDTHWEGRVRPAPNGLALLRACRRARLEIGNSWLDHVLFCYGSCEDMLDHLSGLPAETLSLIRHARVGTTDLEISKEPGVYYTLVSVLKFLTGLQLDELTVLDMAVDEPVSYNSITRLIVESSGWKTLRYICGTSGVIGFTSRSYNFLHPEPRYLRKPQPMHWQMLMERRDGVASSPSVTIYRAKKKAQKGGFGTVLDPSKRVQFVQKSWEGPPNVFRKDKKLMTEGELEKEMLVIVKRGTGVDYEEKKDSPFAELDPDLRRDYPGMTWHQIWAEYIHGADDRADDWEDDSEDDSEDDGEDDGEDDDSIGNPAGEIDDIVDKYVDVDEYLGLFYI